MRRRNQRTIVILLSFVICMGLLGIGYAAFTGNLQINGSATITKSTINVKFLRVSEVGSYPSDRNITKTANITDDDTATFNVSGLMGYNDYAYATYVVKNTGNTTANLSTSITNSNSTYFNVEANLSKNTIDPNEEIYMTVKISVKKVSTTTDQNTTVNVKLTASY